MKQPNLSEGVAQRELCLMAGEGDGGTGATFSIYNSIANGITCHHNAHRQK